MVEDDSSNKQETVRAAPVQEVKDAKPVEEKPLSPKEQEIKDLRTKIDEKRKQRMDIIINIKKKERRLRYKQTELVALAQMKEIEEKAKAEAPAEQQEEPKRFRSIGYLLRQREKLEFKIATEAKTLDNEKKFLRMISTLNEEIEEAKRANRTRRKGDFVKKDIEDLTREIAEEEEKIKGTEHELDELYSKLRQLTNFKKPRYEEGGARPHHEHSPKQEVQISFEDVAIIKKKESDNRLDDEIDSN